MHALARAGFVTFRNSCYFRAGNAESAAEVISAKMSCHACNLFVILRAGENGLGHAFSGPQTSNWPHIQTFHLDTGQVLSGLAIAIALILCIACIAYALFRARERGAFRNWQRLTDDNQSTPARADTRWMIDPESNAVNLPRGMDERTLMARVAGGWFPAFFSCAATSRTLSGRTRPSRGGPAGSADHKQVSQVRVLPAEGSYTNA